MAEALTLASVGPKPTRHIVLKYRDSPIPRTRQRRSLQQTGMSNAARTSPGSNSTVLSANAVQKQENNRVSKPKTGDRRFSRVVVSDEEDEDGPNFASKATLRTTSPTGNSNTNDTINDSHRTSAADSTPTQLNPVSRGKGRPSKKRKGRKPRSDPAAGPFPLQQLLGTHRGAPDLHDSEYLEYQQQVTSQPFLELRAGALLGCGLALDALDAMFGVPVEAQEEWQALDAQVAEALWGIRARWQHLERARKQLEKRRRSRVEAMSLSEVEMGSGGEKDKDNATKSTVNTDKKDNEANKDNEDNNEVVNKTDNKSVNKTDNKSVNTTDNITPSDPKKPRRKKPDLSVDDSPLSKVRATRSRRRSSSATTDTHHDDGATLRRSKRRRT